jgi:septal ring factor EnvC (AmiA/AmiB activator)
MKKVILFIATLFFASVLTYAQQTREELERQKLQLKKELKETEKMLSDNKAKTKENFLQWKLINDKVNIQDRIVENINSDINLLDRSLTATQRDINRYDRLLDTLKQEYAKSMVYAYKNRSNYDFLNFIFSASNFNDAIKRIAYLKSYRNYREMQGQNIIRTQELRKQRVEELTGTKQKKTIVLQSKDQELSELEKQQKEKDRILEGLKKQGGQLAAQQAAKTKQLKKVEGAITAAIKRVIEENRKAEAARLARLKKENDDRLAKERAAEKERLRLEAERNKNNPNAGATTVVKPKDKPPVRNPSLATPPTGREVESGGTVNDANAGTNASFIANRGRLSWPVSGRILYHFGLNIKPPNNTKQMQNCVTLVTQIGAPVTSVFNGVVSMVENDGGIVMIQHGGYFTTYSNLSNISVRTGQQVTIGQTLGKAMANLDEVGEVDFYICDSKTKYYNPETWLR